MKFLLVPPLANGKTPVTSVVKSTADTDNVPVPAPALTTPPAVNPEKVMVPDETTPVAPVIAPAAEMSKLGVFNKLPEIVPEMLIASVKVPAVRVMFKPLVIVPPAAFCWTKIPLVTVDEVSKLVAKIKLSALPVPPSSKFLTAKPFRVPVDPEEVLVKLISITFKLTSEPIVALNCAFVSASKVKAKSPVPFGEIVNASSVSVVISVAAPSKIKPVEPIDLFVKVSLPANVANVPVVGNVTLVAPPEVKVIAPDPAVVKF